MLGGAIPDEVVLDLQSMPYLASLQSIWVGRVLLEKSSARWTERV